MSNMDIHTKDQFKAKHRANLQEKGWHYETTKKQERKETKKFREQRKNKRRQWEMPE